MNLSLNRDHTEDVDKNHFFISSQHFEPAYLALHRRGELKQRVEEALRSLAHCDLYPRDCGVDRLAGMTGVCKTGRYARVSSYFAHFGERFTRSLYGAEAGTPPRLRLCADGS